MTKRDEYKVIMLLIACCTIMAATSNDVMASPDIQGRIYKTEEGDALEGANVILIETLDEEAIITTVRSDREGYYTLTPSQPGEKHIYLWSPGFASKMVVLQFEGDNETHDYTLLKSARLTGTVTDSSNEPIQGAEVKLEFLDTPAFPLIPNICNCDVQTEEEGIFRFRNVEPSRRFIVVAIHPDYQTYVSGEMTLTNDESRDLSIALVSVSK